ncbi:MAG: tyrosine-type recombinase/integrase, partial [Sedimentisphaerales bacterium]|nr:tyrosine-type recombinase/integrase [Sedimentisphaerales bacterium]
TERMPHADYLPYPGRSGATAAQHSSRASRHCLRKSYGTNLADLGTPVHTLKSLMGHSSITMTMKFYIHVSDANKKKAVMGLEGLMGEMKPARY